MKLIKIETDKKLGITRYKENIVTNEINGRTITERIKTGIPEKVQTFTETYYIPIDNIKTMYEFGDKCLINDLQVPRRIFDEVKRELENYEMK